MKFVLAALLLVALVCFAAAVENQELNQDVKVLYQAFLSKYNKVYATNIQEVEKRFRIFQENVEKAKMMNKQSSSESYGISPFMDLSAEEFRSRYLSQTYSKSQLAKKMGVSSVLSNIQKGANEPDNYNWADNGAVTPVKNQGQCGSCWAFSTTGNVEGLYYLKTKNLVSFSEQQLVDCDHQCEPNNPQACDAGCNGGLMDNALRYIEEKGLQPDSTYPYQAVDMSCKYDASKIVTKVTNSTILPNDADKIKSFLLTNGPLAVALNAEWLQTYTSGISDPWLCDPKGLDHGVLIVGYGKGKNWFGTEKEYWIVKNSWSSGWGEKGYFRIVRGKNACGIESMVTSGIAAVPVQ